MSIGSASGSGRHASSGSTRVKPPRPTTAGFCVGKSPRKNWKMLRMNARCVLVDENSSCSHVIMSLRFNVHIHERLARSHLKWSVIYSILPHTPLCGMPCLRLPHSDTRLPHSLLRAESLPKPSAKSALRFYQRWNRSGATTTV